MGNVINGSNSTDTLIAGNNGDTLNGFGGNDVLYGGNGNDVVNGGDGDDFINVRGRGADTVDGGAGNDRVTYYTTVGPLTVNLEAGTADDGSGFIDTLINIERISGSQAFGDVIIGRADTNETLYGNGGNDTLDGGAGGSDTAGYGFVLTGGVMVNLALGTSSGVDGVDVLTNFENIEGSYVNDTLIGDNGANILWGLSGDDILTGAGGNDTLIGSAGNDTAVYSGNRSDYTLTRLSNGDYQLQDNRNGAPDGTDILRGIKTLQFADGVLVAKAQEQVVNANTAGHQLFQAGAALFGTGGAGGNGHVTVFRAADGSGEGIYVRLFDNDGYPRSGDILVNTITTGDQRAPVVGVLGDGGFVVMWDSTPEVSVYTNPAAVEIHLQRFDADGNKVGVEVEVNTTTAYQQRFPTLTNTEDGGFLAVWQSRQDADGSNAGIYGQKFDIDGNKVGGEVQLNTTTAGNQLYPLVRPASYEGGMVVVWQGRLADGSNGYAQQLLDSNGNKVGGELIAYSGPAGAQMNFIHQTLLDDGYVLTWVMTLADGSGAVMGRAFNSDGTPRGAAFTAAAGESYLGTDVISSDGHNVLMVWDVMHSDGDSAIVGRIFDAATGQPEGAAFNVSTSNAGGRLGYPTLSGTGSAGVMVSWNSQGNVVVDSGGVYQQMISFDGQPEYGSFNLGTAPAATSFTVQTVTGGDQPQADATGHYVLNAALSSGASTNLHHLALIGSAAFGTKVTIYAGATALTTVGVDDQGQWAADIVQLSDGVYHLHAVVTDVHGNVSAPSAVFDLTVQSSAVIDGTSGDDAAQYWYNNGANSSAQTLNGGAGNDTLDGGGGADTLNGGNGDDTYIAGADDTIHEATGQGVDTIISADSLTLPDNVENLTVNASSGQALIGNALDNVLRGGSGGDYFDGGAGNDTIYGNGGSDNFRDSTGDDVLIGGDGDDFFSGTRLDSGNDLMDGGAGNDAFKLSAGHDTIIGGAGEDTLYTGGSSALNGVSINLATGVMADNGRGESGSVSGIEVVYATQYSDSLTGASADESFYVYGGNDTVDGGAGRDTLVFLGGGNLTASMVTGIGTSAEGTLHFSNIEILGGGSGHDNLTGSSGNDVLRGFEGNDTLKGGGGNDTLRGDGGANVAVYSGKKADYNISTASDGSITVQDKRSGSADGTDTLFGIRTLTFSDGNIELKAVDHVISSNAGGYQIYQSTAASGLYDGSFIQVFRAADSSGDGLYARVFDGDGNPRGSDILINAGATAGDQRAPVVASLWSGGYAVAYHSNPALGAGYNDSGWDVLVQVLDGNGQPLGSPVNVGGTEAVAQRLPSITSLDAGGFVVTWQSAQAGAEGHLAVYARIFSATGQAVSDPVLVGAASDFNQTSPVVTPWYDGVLVAWNGVTQDGAYGLIEQRLDSHGQKVGDQYLVFATASGAATLSPAHSSRLYDDSHVLTWIYDADGAGAGEDVVMARNYDAEGKAVGEAFIVSTAGRQYSSSVLYLNDGSYLVAWDVENADGSSAIMGRRYSGIDNSALTAEFKISNSPSAGVKLFPTLAETVAGSIVVSWGTQGVAELTGSGGLYQQIIDYNGLAQFYAGDSSTTKPVAPTLTVQTVVGGTQPVLDPAYPSAAYYLKDAPLNSGANVSNSHLVISGTAALGSTITVRAGTTVLGTVAVDDDGRWALDVKSLATGTYALTASVTDVFGKTSAASSAFNLTVNNAITGTAGADGEDYWIIRGANSSAQNLTGLDGNDTLNGGGGNDTLIGGAGDDSYIVNNSGVTIVEAANGGNDTVRTAIGLTLAANVENGVLTSASGAALTGNALNNALTGGDGNDTLNGAAGNDTLAGGKGDDTYVVDAAGDVVQEAEGGGTDTVQVAFTAAGTYTLAANIDNAVVTGTVAISLTGNDGANLLTGNAAANVLTGNGGNDTLNGGAGNDSLLGGDGDDTYIVDAVGDVVVEAANGGTDIIETTLASYTLTAANVERLVYTGSAAFSGSGGSGNDVIFGGSGNDTLNGGAGNDTLNGGVGNDSLLGGDGDDTLVLSSGADVADGGAGGDVVHLSGARGDYTVTRLSATDTKLVHTSSGDSVIIRNVETVAFAGSWIALNELIYNTASPGSDTLVGTSGNDTLDGGAGADVLRGLGGDDVYLIDHKDDVIEEAADAGHDKALVGLAAAGSYTLAVNVEDATATSAAAINLIGNGLDNFLTGNAAANVLTGNDGNDSLVGGAGNDTLIGGAGDDDYAVTETGDVVTELAGGGFDLVSTTLSTYTLAANVEILAYTGSGAFNGTGNELSNWIYGFNGNDTLNGGAGNDRLYGNGGNDSLSGGAGADRFVGGQGNDTIDGGAITDKIGNSDANTVSYLGSFSGINVNLATGVAQDGWGGTDKLSNINIVLGSQFNDSISGSSTLVFEQFEGGGGNDTIDGGVITDTLNQVNSNLVSYEIAEAGVAVNLADGTAEGASTGSDTLLNIDQVRGSAFDDTLVGSDSGLIEQFEGLAGNDSIDGAGGFDFVRYDGAGSAVVVNLASGTASDGDGGTDTLNNIEGVRGSAFDDVLAGGNADHDNLEVFIGNAGNDVIDGGSGYDVAEYSSSLAAVHVNLANGSALDGLGGQDTLASIEGVVGSAFNDTLTGSDAEYETFEGREGNDTIDGKGGIDRVDYARAKAGVVVNLVTGTASDGYGGTDKLLNVEDVVGSIYNDSITGNAADNALVGYLGNDTLSGGAGNDVFFAGSGTNLIDGGADNDTLILQGNFAAYTITRPNATDLVLVNASTGEYLTVRNVEQFSFIDGLRSYGQTIGNSVSNFPDVLTGTSGNDTINGAGGADTMSGGAGDDVYAVDVAGDVIIELAGQGSDLVQVAFTAAGTYTLAAEVENASVTAANSVAVSIEGNGLDNVLLGNGAANKLSGGGGDDTLNGGAGADTLIGGDGDDFYVVDVAGDVVTEAVNAGHDTIQTTLASLTLAANVEAVYYAGAGNFSGTGNALDNQLFGKAGNDTLTGGAGADYLVGDAGNDSLLGGEGNDTLAAGTGASDVIDGGNGIDTVQLLGNFGDYVRTRVNATDTKLVNTSTGVSVTVRNVEQFQFDGVGKTLAEVHFNLTSVGDDELVGTSGNDTINGGLGKDTMSGGTGDDTYVVDVAGDVVIEAADEGNDLVQVAFSAAGSYTLGANIENATITAAGSLAVQVIGNDLDNILIGNAGANKLTGGLGNDTLNGGAGNDTLVGGAGDDVYIVDVAGDVVTEDAGMGADQVRTALATYTLSANVETLVYTGSVAFKGAGNALDNDIFGGNGNDTLSGGAGIDYLVGGAGNDSLDGGEGDDTFNSGVGSNDFADGGNGIDVIELRGNFSDYVRSRTNATDTKLVNTLTGETITVRNIEEFQFADGIKTLAQVQFNLTSVGNDVLQGSSGADTLNGGTGADTLTGLAGNDTYVVDVAGDVVVEAADEGIDLVQVAFTAAGSYTLSANVENATVTSTLAVSLVGNALDNVLTGNAAANKLSGDAGNDTLIGGAGIDTLIGGDGDDVYVVDVAGDVVTELASAGTDRVETALASYTLGANLEQLSYTGSAAFSGTGNALANEIRGGNGNDTLNGGAGNDTLRGGTGNDSLLGGDGDDLLLAGTGTTDIIDGGLGADTVEVLGNFGSYVRTRVSATDTRLVNAITGEALTIRNVETVLFANGSKSLAEVNDNLVSAGNDALIGTSGADTLNGGAGIDTLTGLDGNDTYVVDVAGDLVIEGVDEGIDLVQVAFTVAGSYTLGANVENATVTSTLAISLVGNTLDNVLTGNAAANKLTGDDGNDTLIGGAGNDTLIGGAGDDVYVVDAAGDVVTEGVGAGIDRVETTLASYTLASNVEQLTYTGSAAINATGNALDNRLTGGNGNDTLIGGIGNDSLLGGAGNDNLQGGAGSDVLTGGAGNDLLNGGADADTFVLASATGVDTIADLVSGTDLLSISQAALAIGNGDLVIDGAVVRSAAGGFAASAELVVFTQNAAAVTAAAAATVIGSASSGFTLGQQSLFVVDNGVNSYLYLFKSSGTDALVSAAELTQLVILTGNAATQLTDYQFIG